MRAALIALVLGAGLVTPVAAAQAPLRVKLVTGTPRPIVGHPWRWTVTVRTTSGKPLAAKMRLQILLGTTVVGCWKGTAIVQCTGGGSGTWIRFRGRRSGVLTWPAESVGVGLSFQAVVVVGGRTRKLRAPVTVQPAPAPPPTTTTP